MKKWLLWLLIFSLLLVFNISCKKNSAFKDEGVTITVHKASAERNGTGIKYSVAFMLGTIADRIDIQNVYVYFFCNGTLTLQSVFEAKEILDKTYLTPSESAYSHSMNFSSDDIVNISTSVAIRIEYLNSGGEHLFSRLESDVSALADTPIIEYFRSNGHFMVKGDTLILEWSVKNADDIELVWAGGGKRQKVDADGEIQLDPYAEGDTTSDYSLWATNKNGNNTANIIIFLE